MSTRAGDRYQFLERLDAGGMAEVYKAIAHSLEGFEKQVAVKRVLPNLAANDRFIKMFLDEARLSLFLSHTNIVSVFDVIQSESVYLIVMEFIEGANLKRVMEAARTRQGPVPVPIAVYIGVQICQGLDYAHNMKDPRGNALGIVHRDVSPPNVLLSWTGEVKLTDFGLAKATSQVFKTDPGIVKGKFGYLSPEAANGTEVDRRTDIFAAGIVLWEMLAGRRLFQGASDYETLQKVRECEIPSLRGINPAVPVELEEIIKRALTGEPDHRFQTAQDLGRRLSGYLSSTGTAVTAYDVAAYLKAVLAESDVAAGSLAPSAALAQAIQTELARGLSIGRAGGDLTTDSNSGPMEDPREWGDVGFDEHEEPEQVSATHYASGRSEGQSVVIPLSSVRPSRSRGGENTGSRAVVTVRTDKNPAVAPAAAPASTQFPARAQPASQPETRTPAPSPSMTLAVEPTNVAGRNPDVAIDSEATQTDVAAEGPPLKRWLGIMALAVLVLILSVVALVLSRG
jgi:serine/threonine-protein kinase